MIITVISVAPYLTDKTERTALYKINKNVYIKTSKIVIIQPKFCIDLTCVYRLGLGGCTASKCALLNVLYYYCFVYRQETPQSSHINNLTCTFFHMIITSHTTLPVHSFISAWDSFKTTSLTTLPVHSFISAKTTSHTTLPVHSFISAGVSLKPISHTTLPVHSFISAKTTSHTTVPVHSFISAGDSLKTSDTTLPVHSFISAGDPLKPASHTQSLSDSAISSGLTWACAGHE